MCLPPGARDGSASDCWPSSRNGRSGSRSWLSAIVRTSSCLAARHVDGAGAPRLRRLPRDRPVERPVDLDRGRPVAVAAQQRAGTGLARASPASASERVRHHVGDHHVGGQALVAAGDPHAGDAAVRRLDRLDRRAGAQLAAQLAQVADERVGQALGPARRAGPADRVAHQVQIRDRDRAAGVRGRDVAVTGRAVQPRPRAGPGEQATPKSLGRAGTSSPNRAAPSGPSSESSRSDAADRREARRASSRGSPRNRRAAARRTPASALPSPALRRLEARLGRVEVAVERHRAPVRERMGVAGARVDPAQAVVVRAASGRTPARRRRPDRPRRTCRGGSPAASAPRSAPRRRRGRPPRARSPDGPASASRIAAARPFGPAPITTVFIGPSGVHGRAHATCSASWCSMLSRATSPSPQKACWAARPRPGRTASTCQGIGSQVPAARTQARPSCV